MFPIIFAISFLGCIIGTYLHPLEDIEAVKNYYIKTKPWGFWGPIKRQVMLEYPDFEPNKDLKRDALNILVGIVWQMAQVLIPVYFMIRENYYLLVWSIVLMLTSWWLKKNWWDRLKEADTEYQIHLVEDENGRSKLTK